MTYNHLSGLNKEKKKSRSISLLLVMCLHNWVTKENASHGDIWVEGLSFIVFFFQRTKKK